MPQPQKAISLFTSGGIGDLAIRRAGFDIVLSSELLEDRHSVFKANFPATRAVSGDIWETKSEILSSVRSQLNGSELDLLYATPPCQGMSKNGRGKLLSSIRAGLKPSKDLRNRLIIPTMEIASELRPRTILLENVPEMASTAIVDGSGREVSIIEHIAQTLGSEYVGRAEVVEFADYGVPQCRQRLITIFSRDDRMREWFRAFQTFLPSPTHCQYGRNGRKTWVTVREAIGSLPKLDAKNSQSAVSAIPFHRVPVLDEMKYWWVENTPTGRGAFDNQCCICGYSENPIHGARREVDGVNRASRSTPLHCEKCGSLLPRPSVEREGERVLMRGFTSAYKRMSYDKPSSALTRNLSYACSDNKLHPEQNRVLSLYEAFCLHTLDQYEYRWIRDDGKRVSDKTIREIIGESIPPAGLQKIVDHLAKIANDTANGFEQSGPLFADVKHTRSRVAQR